MAPSGAFYHMGICFQTLDEKQYMGDKQQTNTPNGWVWVVVRRSPEINPDIQAYEWHLQGVAEDEQIAVQMCLDEHYMIGPVPLNFSLPHNKIEWIGSYFPLKKT